MYPLQDSDPTTVGRYRLLGRLGSGGMGSVYLGRTPGGRPAAVKVINAHLQDEPEALDRFRREVETLGAVRNAFTAALIDAEVGTPPFWMATEYVPGPTLADAVETSGPFPVDLVRAVLAALAEGLADIHVHGVLHRDIKPQNIILSATGPQLIDFGIARSDAMPNLTLAGTAIGTPGFIAPETLTDGETGPASDVFALGVTMAYCLTGRPPYGQGSAATVSYRSVHGEMDLDGVPEEMAGLIRACADKDPARRPAPHRIVELCDSETDIVRHPAYQRIIAAAPSLDVPAGARPEPSRQAPPESPRQASSESPRQAPEPTVVDGPTPTVVDNAAPTVPANAAPARTRLLPPPTQLGGPPRDRTRRGLLLAVGAVVALGLTATAIVVAQSTESTADAKKPKASASSSEKAEELPPQELTVRAERTLRTGESWRTTRVRLVMGEDGNLVSLDGDDQRQWESGTSGENYQAVFQDDGNLVVYTADHKPVWASNTGAYAGAVLELRPDGVIAIASKDGQDVFRTVVDPALPQDMTVTAPKTLAAGEFLQTAHLKLIMQKNGNLVAYDEANQRLWDTGTSGENHQAVFQDDGNLVVYTAEHRPVWASQTGAHAGAVMELRPDGAVAIKSKDGQDVWRSDRSDG
ncbi:protein kinase domain-containing protein [Streptomyces sp. CRN 30]|uniref:protein kinase domain-containing protein n=1 Tax=Streptomyces sp. CRN 30 TaxID=3075613 RepID=UPI002A80D410|nr:protein kinase [Streptomyces sp. CRN 30]